MTAYLSFDDLLFYGEAAVGHPLEIRDRGLVESALFRPQASAFGVDAYPTLHEKAAALLQSIATNHGLIDGNKRTALAAAYAFLATNGVDLTLSADDAVTLVLEVANKDLVAVDEIAARLRD